MFQSRAMLVELNLRQWTGQKLDKSAAAQIATAHQARSDSGKYIKRLVPTHALGPITRELGRIRAWHYRRTLPWGNNGQRLLPAKHFMEYRTELAKHNRNFASLVDRFVREYPLHRLTASKELGTLFDAREYPAEEVVRKAFGIDLTIFPIPTSGDFRIEVAEEEKATILKGMESEFAQRQQAIVTECYARAREVIERVQAQCLAEKPRITQSLITSWQALPENLRTLNVAGDRNLNNFATALDNVTVGPYELRIHILGRMNPHNRRAFYDCLEELKARIPTEEETQP